MLTYSDGQKKPVSIYRLLTANTIDEKIYQRQLTKTGLSDQMMAKGGAKGNDTKDCGSDKSNAAHLQLSPSKSCETSSPSMSTPTAAGLASMKSDLADFQTTF